jgi:ferrous iron transport protein A
MFPLLFTDKTMKAGHAQGTRHGKTEPGGTEHSSATPLDKLPGGGIGTVCSIGGASTPLRQRLMELGITIGSEIQVIRKAPFGGPIEISIRGYRLSLRRTEARIVLIDRRP